MTQAHEELRAGIAVLTTAYQTSAGEMSIENASAVFAALAVETFPEHPVELVLPTAWVALRALSMAAQALGIDIPTLLQQLAVECIPPE